MMSGKIYAACWTTNPLEHSERNTIATRGSKNLRHLKGAIKKLAKAHYDGRTIYCYIWTTDKIGAYYIYKCYIDKINNRFYEGTY